MKKDTGATELRPSQLVRDCEGERMEGYHGSDSKTKQLMLEAKANTRITH